jgi:hypothetical protein
VARRSVTNHLSYDEARRIATNMAKLSAFVAADKHRKAKGE